MKRRRPRRGRRVPVPSRRHLGILPGNTPVPPAVPIEGTSDRVRIPGLFWFFILFAVLYQFSGWRQPSSWHPASNYLLVKAIGDRGSFAVDNSGFAAGTDVSVVGDRTYSSKDPGLPFLCVPFYWVGKGIAAVFNWKGVCSDAFVYQWTRLPVSLMGAGCVVLFAWILGSWGLSSGRALLWATVIGLGTQMMKYSADLFVHTPSVFAVLICLVLAGKTGSDPRRSFFAGVIAGYAVVIESRNLLMAPLMLAGMLVQRRSLRDSASFIGGFLVGVFPLLAYQWVCFGGPFQNTYLHQMDVNRVVAVTMPGFAIQWPVIFSKMSKLFFETRTEPRVGLMILSPILWLAPIGFVLLAIRHRWAQSLLILGVSIGILGLVSTLGNIFGGGTNDVRYLTQVEILLALAAVLALEEMARRFSWVLGKVAWSGLIWAIAGWQILIHQYFRCINADRYYFDFTSKVLRANDAADLLRTQEGMFEGSGWIWIPLGIAALYSACGRDANKSVPDRKVSRRC